MSPLSTDQEFVQKLIPTLQQMQREGDELDKRMINLEIAIGMAEEQLVIMQNANNAFDSKIEEIKVDVNRSINESHKLKSITLFLFGCSVVATIIIYCFNPSLSGDK